MCTTSETVPHVGWDTSRGSTTTGGSPPRAGCAGAGAANATRTTVETSSSSAPVTGQGFLKDFDAISGGMNPSEAPTTGRPPSPHSPPGSGGFALSGPSDLPDPSTHAYRTDLADVALVGRVIASHFAEPLVRHLTASSPFYVTASPDSDVLTQLDAGAELRILDNSRGWAWGYGPDGRVGYVRADAIGV